MCSLHVEVHVKCETSPAAQRAETFEKQGFKNMFVKVFYKKPNYFPIKITIEFNNYHFHQKHPNFTLKTLPI